MNAEIDDAMYKTVKTRLVPYSVNERNKLCINFQRSTETFEDADGEINRKHIPSI